VTYRVSLGTIDLSVHKLFTTRADLHRTVYTHAKVKVQTFHHFEIDLFYLLIKGVYHPTIKKLALLPFLNCCHH
jgi:hypothetical protein